jgi:hypothetical protein
VPSSPTEREEAPEFSHTLEKTCHDRKKHVSFYDRFELLELVRDDGVKTFRARVLATGRAVEAHLFVHPHAPLSVALLSKLEKLDESQVKRIIERGKHEGTPWVVTEPITDFGSFREWLSYRPSDLKPTAPPPPRPAPPAKAGPPPLPPPPPVEASELPPTQVNEPTAEAPSLSKAGAWQVKPVSAPPPSAVDQEFESLFANETNPELASTVRPWAPAAANYSPANHAPASPSEEPKDTKIEKTLRVHGYVPCAEERCPASGRRGETRRERVGPAASSLVACGRRAGRVHEVIRGAQAGDARGGGTAARRSFNVDRRAGHADSGHVH